MLTRYPLLALVVMLGASVSRAADAPVPSSLRLELAEVAKGIKQLLDGRSETSIAVQRAKISAGEAVWSAGIGRLRALPR